MSAFVSGKPHSIKIETLPSFCWWKPCYVMKLRLPICKKYRRALLECSKGNDATATLAKSVGLVKDSEYRLNEFACAK